MLRQVLLQNYTRTITADGREVIKRREKEPEGDGLPPGHARIASPYDTDARWGVKRDTFWLGYKLHVTETCDDEPRCGCPAAGDGGTGRRGHDKHCPAPAFPNLITHVATTDATVPDSQMTSVICDDLVQKNLAPGRSYLDSGYLSAALVVTALATWGIALIGPLLADTSAQARAGKGYARADFAIDYDSRTVTCPQGKASASWTPCTQRGKDAIVVQFSARDCGPCPSLPETAAPARHVPCVPPGNGASSPCRRASWPQPRPPPAPRRRRSRSRRTTPAAPASRAPCTKPPATARDAPATVACPRPASTTCTWPARSTSFGCTPTGPVPR